MVIAIWFMMVNALFEVKMTGKNSRKSAVRTHGNTNFQNSFRCGKEAFSEIELFMHPAFQKAHWGGTQGSKSSIYMVKLVLSEAKLRSIYRATRFPT